MLLDQLEFMAFIIKEAIMKDWVVRAIKTFVQAFLGVLIPEIVCWCNNISGIDWANWKVWLLPVVGAGVAAGISAVWNIVLEKNKQIKV